MVTGSPKRALGEDALRLGFSGASWGCWYRRLDVWARAVRTITITRNLAHCPQTFTPPVFPWTASAAHSWLPRAPVESTHNGATGRPVVGLGPHRARAAIQVSLPATQQTPWACRTLTQCRHDDVRQKGAHSLRQTVEAAHRGERTSPEACPRPSLRCLTCRV
jgi:hypothetical protein